MIRVRVKQALGQPTEYWYQHGGSGPWIVMAMIEGSVVADKSDNPPGGNSPSRYLVGGPIYDALKTAIDRWSDTRNS